MSSTVPAFVLHEESLIHQQWVEPDVLPDWGGHDGAAMAASAAVMIGRNLSCVEWSQMRKDENFMAKVRQWRQSRKNLIIND